MLGAEYCWLRRQNFSVLLTVFLEKEPVSIASRANKTASVAVAVSREVTKQYSLLWSLAFNGIP
jgi:hypothetical protein